MADKAVEVGYLTDLLDMMNLMSMIDSVDSDMERFEGDGNKIFEQEHIAVGTVNCIARKRVAHGLAALDQSEDVTQLRAKNTDEMNRLASHISMWVEGFVVGARWGRAQVHAERIVDHVYADIKEEDSDEGS